MNSSEFDSSVSPSDLESGTTFSVDPIMQSGKKQTGKRRRSLSLSDGRKSPKLCYSGNIEYVSKETKAMFRECGPISFDSTDLKKQKTEKSPKCIAPTDVENKGCDAKEGEIQDEVAHVSRVEKRVDRNVGFQRGSLNDDISNIAQKEKHADRKERRRRGTSPPKKAGKNKRHSRSRSKDRYPSRHRLSPQEDFNLEGDRKRSNTTGKDGSKVECEKIVADSVKHSEKITERQRRTVDLLTSRTGGAYIPPAKLRLLQAEITDKSSAAYQRIAWEALKKSIHGYINKVNVDNIGIITRELLKENIIRGRGLLCRSIIQAQAASPTFTHVYAALVAIINSKFPNIGELLLKRLVIQFRRGFRRNDKSVCISSSRFIAHLVNQRVAHEILALEILTLLVETPTDDSVEVAIAFLKECGMKLTEVSAKGVNAIFEMLKNILHEGKLDKRVQYMIEVVFQVRKDGFKDHQSVIEALELVEEDDQFTHLIMLDEATDGQDHLNAFKFDDKYETNEDKYKGLSKELLGSDASDSENGSTDSEIDDSDDGDEEEKKDGGDVIIDNTETNLVALRRTIYLTIHSSLDYEECAHKLMKMELKPGQEMELCHMFLDCCAEQRTYEKFFGLLAQRFCMINKIYIEPFEQIFRDTYHTTHRLDTNRLRNVSKFFAHLLFTDAIGWDVLECIKLNEDDTTSSSRIFIKILFQELAEYMGLSKLNERLKDATLVESFSGIFPRDNPRNTRFAINFFTSIGLGGLTDELREFLKSAPKVVPAINQEILGVVNTNSSSSSSSSSSSVSSSSSSDSSSSSSISSIEESCNKKSARIKKKRPNKGKNRGSTASSSSEGETEKEKSKSKRKKRSKTDRKRFRGERERTVKGVHGKERSKSTPDFRVERTRKIQDKSSEIRRGHRTGNRDQQLSPKSDGRRYDNRGGYPQVSRQRDYYRYENVPKDQRKERGREESRSSRIENRGISKERG